MGWLGKVKGKLTTLDFVVLPLAVALTGFQLYSLTSSFGADPQSARPGSRFLLDDLRKKASKSKE
jgi:hypothetical protein